MALVSSRPVVPQTPKTASLPVVQPHVPSFILLLLALGQAGCSNMLGLDDLSFEQGEGDAPRAGVGGASAAAGGAGEAEDREHLVLGSAGGTPSEPNLPDFPAVWPKGALITALIGEDDNSPYWFYDPEAERLHSFQSLPDRTDGLSVRSWKGGWSHLISYETNEGRHLLGYDSAQGFLSELVEVEGEDERLQEEFPAGTRGRTHLLSLDMNGGPHTFVYSRESGSFRFFSADSSDDEEVCMGTWDAGWDQVIPYRRGDVEGVLLFNPETGVLQFESLDPCGSETSTQFSFELSNVPALIFTFPDDGTSSLYFYHPSGMVRNVALEDGDGGVQIGIDLDDGIWREGLSAVVPLRVQGKRQAITYDGVSGVAELRSLEVLTDDTSIVIK